MRKTVLHVTVYIGKMANMTQVSNVALRPIVDVEVPAYFKNVT
jgi:hypothetical protein